MLRPKTQKTRNSCGSIDIIIYRDLQSPSDLLDKTLDVKTLNKPRAYARQSNTRQIRSVKLSQTAKESDVRHRQYCT
jgi:hypothetical protein